MTHETDDAYCAARIHAARSRLIGRAEYDRLMRMSDVETLGYLQSTTYRPDVDALGIKDLDDLEAIDRVIAHHEDRALLALERLANASYAPIVRALLDANDAWNVRVAAEAIVGGEDVASALARFARPGRVPFAAYATARTLADLARLASGRFRRLLPADLPGFLDTLESAHARDPLPAGPAGRLFADERNLSRALRCMREGVPVESAVAGMARGGMLSRSTLRRIAAAKDLTEALRIMRETPYREAAERTLVDGTDMAVRAENDIHRAVLRALAKMTRADPLGPGVLARHVAEIGMESANLRLLMKARRLGLDEAFVRDRLAVP